VHVVAHLCFDDATDTTAVPTRQLAPGLAALQQLQRAPPPLFADAAAGSVPAASPAAEQGSAPEQAAATPAPAAVSAAASVGLLRQLRGSSAEVVSAACWQLTAQFQASGPPAPWQRTQAQCTRAPGAVAGTLCRCSAHKPSHVPQEPSDLSTIRSGSAAAAAAPAPEQPPQPQQPPPPATSLPGGQSLLRDLQQSRPPPMPPSLSPAVPGAPLPGAAGALAPTAAPGAEMICTLDVACALKPQRMIPVHIYMSRCHAACRACFRQLIIAVQSRSLHLHSAAGVPDLGSSFLQQLRQRDGGSKDGGGPASPAEPDAALPDLSSLTSAASGLLELPPCAGLQPHRCQCSAPVCWSLTA
jgi:hypothetical protein